MVLESLIQDDRKLTLDGCRATITKQTKAVEIPDEMYRTAEVQGAIKLGLVKLVGEPPVSKVPLAAVVMPEKKLKNVTKSKISIDCVKGLVMPGCYISIPVDKLDVYEVQNSIQSGWLVDEENPLPQRPIPTTKHVPLEELTAADVNEGPSELTLPGQKKVLQRASVEDDFYKPSQIQQLAKKKGLKGAKAPAPDQPSKIQIVQKQPISMEPKPQQKAVSEELVDFLVTPAEKPAEPLAEAKEQPAQEAEKTSEADDPLGFLLS
jgi:hypothetical protein